VKHERSNHVVFRTEMKSDGTKGVDVHTPERVLPVHTKEELEAQLKHYAKVLLSLHTTNKTDARRKYVELIRPALRYYCKKFNVVVPAWLATDDYYTKHMSVAERQKMFGMKPLRIGEFQKMKPLGSEGFDYPGKTGSADQQQKKEANG
jgi:hypothetical protein